MVGLPIVLLQQAGGDREVLMGLYDRYGNYVLALARRKLPWQEAEDVLYAVLERLLPYLSRIGQLAEPQRKAYVYAAARSVIADRLRRRSQERARIVDIESQPVAAMEDSSQDVEQLLVYRETVRQMRRAICALPEEQRALLEMRYIMRLDDGEIARRLGVSRDGVRQRMFRVRKKLRQLMQEEV